MPKVFVISLFLLIPKNIYGQDFVTINFSVPEGMPSAEVYSVYQDQHDFLWFATDNGVAVYDGEVIQTFNVKDGLSDPVVFGFFDDEKERLWFRTFTGKLSYYQNGKFAHYKYNKQLVDVCKNEIINTIYVNEDDDLYFSTARIIGKIDRNGIVTAGLIDRGQLVLKSEKEIDLYGAHGASSRIKTAEINSTLFNIQLSDTINHNQVQCTIRWNNKTYITINNDIFEYDGFSLKKVFTTSYQIINLSTDREGNLWIGYVNGGADQFSDGFKRKWSPAFLSGKSVTDIYQSKDREFWFSTLEHGVIKLPDQTLHSYSIPEGAKIKSIHEIGDNIILSNHHSNIYIINKLDEATITRKTIGYPAIAFCEKNNNIFISTGQHVLIFDSTLTKIQKDYQLYTTDFSKSPNGKIWSVGGHRITVFNANNDTIVHKDVDIIYRIINAEDSLLYLAARNGLHIRDTALSKLIEPSQFADFKIAGIEHLNDTTMAISTIGHGLLIVNKKNLAFTQFHSKSQFVADNIYTIKKRDSTLWLGTEKGLIAVSISSLLRGEPNLRQITERNGLINDKINFLAFGERSVWAFSQIGYSVIPLSSIDSNNVFPRFYLKGVNVNGVPAANTDSLTLAHNQNNIEFSFGHITFKNETTYIRYRLTPDAPWTLTNEKIIRFSSLAPNEYNWEIENSIDNIHWRKAYAIPFIIQLPWWKRWYSILSLMVAVVGLIYIYSNNQISLLRQKQTYLKATTDHQQKLIQSEIETLERERRRISRELHDGVSTNLSAIKLIIRHILKKHQDPRADVIEEQLQHTIKELKAIIYGLTPPGIERYGLFTALKNYTNGLNHTIPQTIQLNLYGEDSHDHSINITVFRIVQELMANTLKHADAKTITIHISIFDDLISLLYEDNGKGIKTGSMSAGLGMDNVESRITSLHGNLHFESGQFGTSYSIDIPLKQNLDYQSNKNHIS